MQHATVEPLSCSCMPQVELYGNADSLCWQVAAIAAVIVAVAFVAMVAWTVVVSLTVDAAAQRKSILC